MQAVVGRCQNSIHVAFSQKDQFVCILRKKLGVFIPGSFKESE